MLSSIVSAAAWASRRRTSTCAGPMGSPGRAPPRRGARRRAGRRHARAPRLHRAAASIARFSFTNPSAAASAPTRGSRRARRLRGHRPPGSSSAVGAHSELLERAELAAEEALYLGGARRGAPPRARAAALVRIHLAPATPQFAAQIRPPCRARPRRRLQRRAHRVELALGHRLGASRPATAAAAPSRRHKRPPAQPRAPLAPTPRAVPPRADARPRAARARLAAARAARGSRARAPARRARRASALQLLNSRIVCACRASSSSCSRLRRAIPCSPPPPGTGGEAHQSECCSCALAGAAAFAASFCRSRA